MSIRFGARSHGKHIGLRICQGADGPGRLKLQRVDAGPGRYAAQPPLFGIKAESDVVRKGPFIANAVFGQKLCCQTPDGRALLLDREYRLIALANRGDLPRATHAGHLPRTRVPFCTLTVCLPMMSRSPSARASGCFPAALSVR